MLNNNDWENGCLEQFINDNPNVYRAKHNHLLYWSKKYVVL